MRVEVLPANRCAQPGQSRSIYQEFPCVSVSLWGKLEGMRVMQSQTPLWVRGWIAWLE